MHRGTGTGGLYADYGGNGSPPENRAQPNATAAERAPKPYSVYSLAFPPPAGGACLGAQEPQALGQGKNKGVY